MKIRAAFLRPHVWCTGHIEAREVRREVRFEHLALAEIFAGVGRQKDNRRAQAILPQISRGRLMRAVQVKNY
jgi:hypothetical protein